MKLSEALSQPSVIEPKPSRSRDWNFTQEHAPHDSDTRLITATVPVKLETEDDWTQFVIDNGGAVAPGYRVRLVEMRHNTAGWTRDDSEQKYAVTRGTWFYRFAVEPVIAKANIEDLIKLIKRKKRSVEKSSGVGTHHLLFGDTQLGKMDGDGTDGIVDRVVSSIENGKRELKRLSQSRQIGKAHIAWLGDCGEGNQSQGGRNMWRTELTVTEQYRVFRRLMLYAIDEISPLVEQIESDVVNGNHDDVQRNVTTRADDGHATESAIALSDALKLNPDRYDHVKIFVPNKDESFITREIGSSVFTMAHGHQWARGKSMTWWAGQTFNWQAPAASQFLLHGHEHEFSIQSKRDRLVLCVPTFESESTWWRHKTGDMSKQGAISMVTAEGEFSDLAIV